MTKMPFGLCNAPSTYQRLMASTLQSLIGRICLAYIDDVIVISKRRSEHVANLRVVFERIRSAKLKLKPKTCLLFCDQVLYLGHVIDVAGVSPDPAKQSSCRMADSEDSPSTAVVPRIRQLLRRFPHRRHPTHVRAVRADCVEVRR